MSLRFALARRFSWVLPVFACSSPPAAKEAPPPPPAASEPAPPTEEPKAEEPAPAAPEPATDASSPGAEPSAEPAAAAPADESDATRQVRYIVNPEGMRVRVSGIELVPKAELVSKGGTVAIKLRVDVRAEDGKRHSLLAPKGKELAFAGKIRRADGSEESFTDQREGDREVVVDEGKDAQLSRSFPDKGAKPLKSGDELELAVGLWGLGDDAASRRPVRAVCKVSLTYPRQKPKLKVTPPDGAGK